MSSRKPMSMHTGHHTKEELAIMKEENDAATGSRNCFTGKPPKGLIDTDAKKEWKRITAVLKEMEIIGDLDLFALIGYCNAFSLYMRATAELANSPPVLETEKGSVKNPLISVQDTYAKQMRDFAMKCGLSVDTRLKYGALHLNKKDEETEEEFGDI